MSNFCCVWTKNCRRKYGSFSFFSLNPETSKHCSDHCSDSNTFSNTLQRPYGKHLYDVSCRVTWITFSLVKISISELNKPLMNSNLSYDTISINSAYLFCCLHSDHFISGNQSTSKFHFLTYKIVEN